MDSRSGVGIEDAAGAVLELPQAATQCADLLAAREGSKRRLASLATEVDAGLLPERSSLVMFGSWGRHELTNESDNDWALLIDDPDLDVDDPSVRVALTHLGEVFGDEHAPGAQAYFGCAFPALPLSERIGLDRDDTRNLTRRMLLLLESEPVTGAEVHREVKTRILDRYLAEHLKPYLPPRFLLNDIIRYWRTMCVDFEGKVEVDRLSNRDKFVTRNAKLRTSRKMLYVSGLLPVLLCHHLSAEHMPAFLSEQLNALATDRVARAFIHVERQDAGLRTMAAYSQWLKLWGDGANRLALAELEDGTRYDAGVFQEVREIGRLIDQGLTTVLFESSLSEIAKKYVAF